MKVKNREMVQFLNNAGIILAKKIPRKLYSVISQNIVAFDAMAKVYNKQLEDVNKENIEEVNELLDMESEVVLQTISEDVLNLMDQDKYDALTGIEYNSLEFLIK